jgi:Cytochrome P460
MKKSRKIIVAILFLCLLVLSGWSLGRSLSRSSSSMAMSKYQPDTSQVKEIAGYRSWTKANAQPVLMAMRTALLCAPVRPVSGAIDVEGPTSPHHDKYITVYVNDVGRKAMLEELKPGFPEGSVIVKEKLPDASSQSPELLTVMIKRAKGFNPESGDWEYMVVNGSGTRVESRGKLENCRSCHLTRPDSDYVFRTYLLPGVTNKMK